MLEKGGHTGKYIITSKERNDKFSPNDQTLLVIPFQPHLNIHVVWSRPGSPVQRLWVDEHDVNLYEEYRY